MRLILIGCECAGKTTLAIEISKWMIQTFGRSHCSLAQPFRATIH